MGLPTIWRGSFTDVTELSDAERKNARLSWPGSIEDIVESADAVDKAVSYAYEKGIIAFDTETAPKDPAYPDHALDPFLCKIVLVQIGDEERQHLLWWQTLDKKAKRMVRDMWCDPDLPKVGVNLKFDALALLGQEGMKWLPSNLLDCQIIEQILCCGLTGQVGQTLKMTGMGPMALRWLGLKLPKDEEIRTGWGDMTPGLWNPTFDEVARSLPIASDDEVRVAHEKLWEDGAKKRFYAADDCVIPLKLLAKQVPWIKHFNLVDTLKLEMKFLPELAAMEIRGVPFDWPMWEELAKEAVEGLRKARRTLDDLFDVTVTHRVDMTRKVETTRDKNYGSRDELKDLMRSWTFEHEGVTLIANNKQFQESLEKAGVNSIRLEKLFKPRRVPNPDKPGKNMNVAYPNMNDLIEGSEYVESLWQQFRLQLPKKVVYLPSTDSKLLRLMRTLHETEKSLIDDDMPTKIGLSPKLITPILDLRDFATKVQRYAYSWKDLIHPVTGRLHTDTTQCAADTARLTTRPNYQNVDSDTRYRACFRVKEDRRIVAGDYSQIEPRIIAEMSDCAAYMRIFWSGSPGTKGFKYWCGDDVTEVLDLYGAMGAAMGVLPKDAEKKSVAKLPESKIGRQKAKIAVLGTGYGTGKAKFHVMMILDTGEYVPLKVSDGIYDEFFTVAAEVKETLDKLSALCDPQKSHRKVYHPLVEGRVTYSENLSGRKRFFDTGSPAWWTVGRNHPIQSLGADILKDTVIEMGQWLRENDMDAYIILTSHDEILTDSDKEIADVVAKELCATMSRVGQRYCPHVPITASPTITLEWVKD